MESLGFANEMMKPVSLHGFCYFDVVYVCKSSSTIDQSCGSKKYLQVFHVIEFMAC